MATNPGNGYNFGESAYDEGTHGPDPSDYQPSEPKRLLYSESRFTGAMADDIYMQNSMASVLTSNKVTLDQSLAVGVVAEQVTAEKSFCMFLIAGEVNGEIRPLFSTAGALIVAGAALLG
ncbi:MAG TPA: hypothetical protein VEI97_09580, partial [bacterium]|nr:hypothetical protein [bacterium]